MSAENTTRPFAAAKRHWKAAPCLASLSLRERVRVRGCRVRRCNDVFPTPKVLRTIAWGCPLLATPGRQRSAHSPWVAAEKTRQPRAMLRNAFGVGPCPEGEARLSEGEGKRGALRLRLCGTELC